MEDIIFFKKKNKIEINFYENKSLGLEDYEIEFCSKTNKVIEKIVNIKNLEKLKVLKPEAKNYNVKNKKFKKKKYFKSDDFFILLTLLFLSFSLILSN